MIACGRERWKDRSGWWNTPYFCTIKSDVFGGGRFRLTEFFRFFMSPSTAWKQRDLGSFYHIQQNMRLYLLFHSFQHMMITSNVGMHAKCQYALLHLHSFQLSISKWWRCCKMYNYQSMFHRCLSYYNSSKYSQLTRLLIERFHSKLRHSLILSLIPSYYRNGLILFCWSLFWFLTQTYTPIIATNEAITKK